MHIDEDTLEASSPVHSPTPVNLESVEFLLVPRIQTRGRKVKSIQTPVQPTIQTDHPDHMVKLDEPVSNSPMFTLASVSTELLEAVVLEIASPSAQGKGSEK